MNNSTWLRLHTSSPEVMTTGDFDGNGSDDILVDFGASHPSGALWRYMNNTTWDRLHYNSPEYLETGNIDGN